MDFQKPFTVADVLRRPLFREARVVAGSGGLYRPVRWVHVLEASEAASFVHGQELILTTGVGLDDSPESVLRFVRQLVECRVSGLCIELGKRFKEIPEPVLRCADRHDFPVILFDREVRFIDITQDIHAYLINRHHHQLVALEAMSSRFFELTLKPQGIRRILELLAEETGCPVRLLDETGMEITVPEEATQEGVHGTSVLCQPIVALDMKVGELHLYVRGKSPEFLQLVLDRAATAIAQEMLRRLSAEERRLRKMQNWIADWLHHGRGDIPGSIHASLKAGGSLVLAAIRPDRAPSPAGGDLHPAHEDLAVLEWARQARRFFETLGLDAWLAPQGDLWTAVLADRQTAAARSVTERVKAGFASLFRRQACRFLRAAGISSPFRRLSEAPHHWKQAKLALMAGECRTSDDSSAKEACTESSRPFSVTCFDELHDWQLFLQVNPDVLTEYIRHQIGPLLEYDRKHGTELVRTLEAFIASGRSKRQAAQALFIHRQTLYYRLEQIAALLGSDWETPSRWLALATALAAHRYLSVQGRFS